MKGNRFLWILTVLGTMAATTLSANDSALLAGYDFQKASDQVQEKGKNPVLTLKLSGAEVKPDNEIGVPALCFDGSADSFAGAIDSAKYNAWRRNQKLRDVAIGFYIKFNNGVFSSYRQTGDYTLGFIDCSLNKDGKIQVRYKVKPGEIGPKEIVLTATGKAEFNKWYHVETNYSINRHRTSLYIDGKFQMEKIETTPCDFTFGELKLGGFRGELAKIRVYDAPLNSEDLLPATAQNRDALQTRYDEVRKNPVANPHLQNWLKALDPAKCDTVADQRQLENDLNNAERLMKAETAGGPNRITNKAVTAFEVTPMSQEMLTERKLPEVCSFSSAVRIMLAKNEFESASFLVFAYQPAKLTFKISDLRCGGNVIPASFVDLYMVKRWIRCGGAWMSYHADKYQRLLVPDMLLKDENMIRVDEVRRTNELRLTYPGNTVYADVSQFSLTNDPRYDVFREPLEDADTLQPVTIPEAGRTQQMWINFHAPEKVPAGLYEGTIQILANGKDAGTLKLQVRLLPFDLPDAKTYYDLNRNFLTWLTGELYGDQKYKEAMLKMLSEHSIRNYQGFDFSSEEAFRKNIELRKKYGMDNSIILGGHVTAGGRNYKMPKDVTTRDMAEYEKAKAKKGAEVEKQIGWVKKYLGHDQYHFYGNDEAAGYFGLRTNQEPYWVGILEKGGKICGAGCYSSFEQVADTQTVLAITTNEQIHADRWHSVHGRILNYAAPFSGPENPLIFRRGCGMRMYKINYDGWFLLSFLNTRVPWNEFAGDPGGDGNYRNFCMAYPTRKGPVDTLALCGLRESIDDIRYATLLKMQAEKAAASSDLELQREGKRQLAWLQRVDPEECDLDDVRVSMIDRILLLQKMNEIRGGKQ